MMGMSKMSAACVASLATRRKLGFERLYLGVQQVKHESYDDFLRRSIRSLDIVCSSDRAKRVAQVSSPAQTRVLQPLLSLSTGKRRA